MGDIMARYKVTINTDTYVLKSCSKKNWEPGTMNDFMLAINGWKSTENNLQEVKWRLKLFNGSGWDLEEWNNEKKCLSEEYQKWRNKKCNDITYYDRLCELERTQEIRGYGFTQGYFSIDDVIQKLSEEGKTIIPFEWLYGGRQYYKGMSGCYMEIEKTA